MHEAENGARVAVPGVVLVFDDLLDGAARVDAEGLEFDLDGGDAVDEQDDVVAVVAIVGVDAELAPLASFPRMTSQNLLSLSKSAIRS